MSRIVAVGLASAFAAGVLAFAAPASAGGQIVQSASATALCDPVASVDVEIFDNISTNYDTFLFLGEVEVASALDRPDTDEGLDPIILTGEGGAPLEDGVYTVQVFEVEGDFTFTQDVTVDCVPDVPETEPTPETTAAAPAAQAATASPRFTG
ncbi:MAG: hypothetical protein MUE36_07260 [Acidimicrobiales bacterium]|jgi:hypothetical protein|nr:hypothetical protein [Acidimicrobiales bacterium]